MVHRINVTGFWERVGEQSDDAVWRLWRAAMLDARQFGIWRKIPARSPR
jgi:hypothetical protein